MTVTAIPSAPQFEHRRGETRALGVGTATPRLSWTLADAPDGFAQEAYEVEVTRDGWSDSYVVTSSEQVFVPWPAAGLASREAAAVRIRVSDGTDWSGWGPSASVEAGLLEPSDWTAAFVSPIDVGGLDQPAPLLTGEIEILAPVRRARLYATAHGIYEARLNGARIDRSVLAPGWTAYRDRLRYHAYDVTELMREGRNEFTAVLGNGWYRGYLSYMGERALYGDRLALCAQLEVTTVDGRTHVLATDGTWTAHETGILANDLYNGQVTDLRIERAQAPASAVEAVPSGTRAIVAADGPPIRPTGARAAERVWTSPSGRTLVDFGQNAVGWVRLTVRGLSTGSEVTVRHAEVIENDELGTRPLRAARATDSWILAGPETTVLEPSLTLHGFRYAEVTGVPGLRAEDIEMVVIGTDLVRTGWFDSSHAGLNRLHENVVWSTRGNFVDLPTDCPQRDERLGWTGDIQVFAPTSLFLFDVSGLLTSWLADLAAEQYPDGTVSHVVPDTNTSGIPDPAAAAWGDAAAFVPWALYQRTGDAGILARQLPSMRAWVDRVATLAGEDRLWTGGFQFGDWLDPSAPPERPADAKAAAELVATAHFARSARIVSQAAAVVGDPAAAAYGALAAEVEQAFAHAYVTPSGRLVSEAQTSYALALEWGLLPTPAQREEAGRRLADLVRQSGFRIATGFVGTPLICDALAHAGYPGLAHRLLLQTECPSWLYPVSMGATTIWERWDSMLPDGTINPGEMTSFNHYALGAVADWLHRSVAGLAPAAPGYRRIRIAPIPPAALDRATATHLSPYGEIAVGWERAAGVLAVRARIPAGVEAEVSLPGMDDAVTGPGEHRWEVPDPHARAGAGLPEGATIRDLVDHEPTWRAVVDAVTRAGLTPGGEAEMFRLLAPYLDAPATAVADCVNLQVHPYVRVSDDHPLFGEVGFWLRAPASAPTS